MAMASAWREQCTEECKNLVKWAFRGVCPSSFLIESAQSVIVLIDPYSDAVTLEVLSKKRPGVKVRLVCKDRGKPTPTEIAKFNRQYKGLSVTYSDDFHDRFLVIDNIELHGLGSSINCLGRRVTSYTPRDEKEVAKLLAMVP